MEMEMEEDGGWRWRRMEDGDLRSTLRCAGAGGGGKCAGHVGSKNGLQSGLLESNHATGERFLGIESSKLETGRWPCFFDKLAPQIDIGDLG